MKRVIPSIVAISLSVAGCGDSSSSQKQPGRASAPPESASSHPLAEEIKTQARILLAKESLPDERLKAVEALGASGDADAATPLLQALKSGESQDLRSAAAEALGALGAQPSRQPLLDILEQDNRWESRWAAARALGRFPGNDVVSALIHSLESDLNPVVRAEAAHALGRLKETQAVPPLKQALDDSALVPHLTDDGSAITRVDKIVAMAAAGALEKLETPFDRALLEFDWVEEATTQLEDPATSESEKAHAAWMLGRSNSPKALEPLMRIIEPDSAAGLAAQLSAAESLGHGGYFEALPLLRETLQSHYSRDMRGAAALALAELDDKEAVLLIRQAQSQGKISDDAADAALKLIEATQ